MAIKQAARGTKVQWTSPATQARVVQQKRAARQKPTIEWTDAPAGTSLKRTAFPATYREPPNIDPAIAARFVVGAPVMAARPLRMCANKGVYQHAPLEEFFGDAETEAHIPRGSLLIYAGEAREVERVYMGRRPHDVSVVKHTFIAPVFGHCIIHDFNLITLI